MLCIETSIRMHTKKNVKVGTGQSNEISNEMCSWKNPCFCSLSFHFMPHQIRNGNVWNADMFYFHADKDFTYITSEKITKLQTLWLLSFNFISLILKYTASLVTNSFRFHCTKIIAMLKCPGITSKHSQLSGEFPLRVTLCAWNPVFV